MASRDRERNQPGTGPRCLGDHGRCPGQGDDANTKPAESTAQTAAVAHPILKGAWWCIGYSVRRSSLPRRDPPPERRDEPSAGRRSASGRSTGADRPFRLRFWLKQRQALVLRPHSRCSMRRQANLIASRREAAAVSSGNMIREGQSQILRTKKETYAFVCHRCMSLYVLNVCLQKVCLYLSGHKH
jgi:hypothetical protein